MKIYWLFIILIFINSCGFKVININEDLKIDVVEINSEGEKKINYILKNKINYSLNQNKDLEDSKPVIIKLKTLKNKTIKEKNIKNEITKYNVSLQIDVEVHNINNQKKIFFTLKDEGNYNVDTQSSVTTNNEKNTIKTLSKRLAEEVINMISNRINDL